MFKTAIYFWQYSNVRILNLVQAERFVSLVCAMKEKECPPWIPTQAEEVLKFSIGLTRLAMMSGGMAVDCVFGTPSTLHLTFYIQETIPLFRFLIIPFSST